MLLARRRLLEWMVGGACAVAWPGSVAWASAQQAGASLPTAPLVIHSNHGPHRLEVELARSTRERARGLMDRDQLAEDGGMLFLYDRVQSSRRGFWMYRTRIPLDIAFIAPSGSIAAIRQMTPCQAQAPSECPAYAAGVSYVAALEVNAGYFKERGIEVGDCVSLPGDIASDCRP
ncbi:DUF192 domain-containing protein [Litchfieldella xinjiangensis]|uniref:DUF192 domain-containing protein n=1 Tax=Litchfieldella xinjiangensis TaxID=1166948 RepID=UPI0005B805D2|nr:DUF192 domain-containing protein [Halomonas xinjiangensis]